MGISICELEFLQSHQWADLFREMQMTPMEKMHRVVSETVSDLKKLDPRQLRLLPPADERVLEDGKTHLTVYHEVKPEFDLIVVQAYRPRLGGLYTELDLEGFVLKSDGEIDEAPENLLWVYT